MLAPPLTGSAAARVYRDVEVPMRDGVVLRADLWLPDSDSPTTVIVQRTPYGKELSGSDMFQPRTACARGYAVLVQDVRGRFASDGEWAPLDWDSQGRDGYDTVEWAATQPWSDGDVVMAGGSYLGIVQWMAAMHQPPHLRAIAPAIATTAELDRIETGGAVRLDQLIGWLAFTGLDWATRRAAAGDPLPADAIARLQQIARDPRPAHEHLPTSAMPYFNLPGFPVDVADVLRGDAGNASVDFGRIRVPVFVIGAYFDLYCRAATAAFHALRAESEPGLRDRHRLLLGPWVHASDLSCMQGELNFGLPASGALVRMTDRQCEFFDVILDRRPSNSPQVDYYQMITNEWRTAATWPPADAAPQHWYLGDGTLSGDAPAEHGTDEFSYDPQYPVPSHGGRILYMSGLVSGPLNQSHLEQRADVVTYTSDRLDAAVEVTGDITVDLHFATDGPDTDVVAKLTDVHPDGRSILVCDGILRARFRKGIGTEIPMPPDVPEILRVDLGPTAWTFLTGHRLRLTVTSSNFPHHDRNLNTGARIGEEATPRVARQTIHRGGDTPSRVTLNALANRSRAPSVREPT